MQKSLIQYGYIKPKSIFYIYKQWSWPWSYPSHVQSLDIKNLCTKFHYISKFVSKLWSKNNYSISSNSDLELDLTHPYAWSGYIAFMYVFTRSSLKKAIAKILWFCNLITRTIFVPKKCSYKCSHIHEATIMYKHSIKNCNQLSLHHGNTQHHQISKLQSNKYCTTNACSQECFHIKRTDH